jgi:hypothetical protein
MGGVGCQPACPHGSCRGRQSRWQAEQCPSAGGADLAGQIGAMLSRKAETGGDDQLGHSDGTSRTHGGRAVSRSTPATLLITEMATLP